MKSQTNRVTWPDGTSEDVVTDMRDWVAYDTQRGMRKWPAIQDAPVLHRAFLVWNAKRRAGDPVEPKFDPQRDAPASVEVDDDEDPQSATPSG